LAVKKVISHVAELLQSCFPSPPLISRVVVAFRIRLSICKLLRYACQDALLSVEVNALADTGHDNHLSIDL